MFPVLISAWLLGNVLAAPAPFGSEVSRIERRAPRGGPETDMRCSIFEPADRVASLSQCKLPCAAPIAEAAAKGKTVNVLCIMDANAKWNKYSK